MSTTTHMTLSESFVETTVNHDAEGVFIIAQAKRYTKK